MQLTGQLIHLRAMEPEDIELLYKWENDGSVWSVSGTVTPFSRYTLEKFVATAHDDIYTTKQLRLMIDLLEKDGDGETIEVKSIGCIDLFDFDPHHLRAGIGVLIADKADRGNGYASEALQLMIDYCFDTLNLHQVYTNITTDNEHSKSLFKKFGFEVTGLKQDWIYSKGRYLDEFTLQLIKKT
jgi:diamine N-acetyltransferase